MNPDRLLALYDRVSEAPDAVNRLRRFVLDLAVRGRLVEQDSSDEPASELLKRIAAEKASLVKAGKIKNSKVPAIGSEDIPYPVPDSWVWTRLGVIGDWGSGSTPSRSNPDLYGGGITWLKSGELGDRIEVKGSEESVSVKAVKTGSFRRNKPGDVLIAMYGATIGKLAILAEEAVTNQAVCGCTPFTGIYNRLLFLFLRANRPAFKTSSEGGAQPNISKVKIVRTFFPLPPLAEQQRIVARVDELMVLLDEFEAARNEREATRDRLTAASLARLTASDTTAETFPAHARFTLNLLPALTGRPDQIEHIRETILELAVRGQLVRQDSTEKPASELLNRIAKQKAGLVDAGKIKAMKSVQPVTNDEMTLDLPTGWEWARVGDLAQFVTSGSRDWAKHYADAGAIFVRMGNLSKGHYRLRLEKIQRVNPPADGEGTRTNLQGGDILISITGDVGMLGLIPEDFGKAYINQHTAMVRPMPDMKGRYLPEVFRSPFVQAQFNAPQRGIKNSFRLSDVAELVIPLPPLAEQQRIVTKVDKLMALCDQMETQLGVRETRSQQLLESLLDVALRPAAGEARIA